MKKLVVAGWILVFLALAGGAADGSQASASRTIPGPGECRASDSS